MADAQIVFTTQCSCFKDTFLNTFKDNRFDYCILDEASQSFLGFTLMASSLAERAVFAGDHKQLPPVVKSKMWTELLEKSLFETLDTARKSQEDPSLIYQLLNVQYRMNQKLMHPSNHLFYDSLV